MVSSWFHHSFISFQDVFKLSPPHLDVTVVRKGIIFSAIFSDVKTLVSSQFNIQLCWEVPGSPSSAVSFWEWPLPPTRLGKMAVYEP